MKQPKISVVIVTWNGASYIEECIDSVLNQKVPDDLVIDSEGKEFFPLFDILVVDNGSDDDTLGLISSKYQGKVNLVKNKINQGFARGYNQAIHWTSGRYILLLNQDVILDRNFLSEASSFLDNYKEVSVVTGTVLKWDWDNKVKTNIVDSLGLAVHKNFRFTNILEGKSLTGRQEIKPVFGFSGAVALTRRQALLDVAYNQQFFDESFWSYKEDIDLSWRLRWRNWDIVYVPQAKAYHKRSVAKGKGKDSLFNVAYHHTRKAGLVNYLSYRNHIILLIKNLPFGLLLRYFLPLMWYEFSKIVYIIFRQPRLLLAWWKIIQILPSLINKRRAIMKSKKVEWQAIKQWIQ